jgi:hypothetical protein
MWMLLLRLNRIMLAAIRAHSVMADGGVKSASLHRALEMIVRRCCGMRNHGGAAQDLASTRGPVHALTIGDHPM